MDKFLVIRADYNDADYVTAETRLSSKPHHWNNETDIRDLLNRVIPALKAQKAKAPHGYTWATFDNAKERPEVMYKDILSPEDIEGFDELVPHGENGIHTIEEIKIVTEGEILYHD